MEEKIFIRTENEKAKEALSIDLGCTFGAVEEAFDGASVQEVLGFPGDKQEFHQYLKQNNLLLD